jgi:hypothetical protein
MLLLTTWEREIDCIWKVSHEYKVVMRVTISAEGRDTWSSKPCRTGGASCRNVLLDNKYSR